jgi:hypothetical protein
MKSAAIGFLVVIGCSAHGTSFDDGQPGTMMLDPKPGLPPGTPKPGTAETCNGTDDDGNGIIDDVDVNHDGVCDCLKIATLGKKGDAGQGNIFATWLSARSDMGATELGDKVLTPSLLAPFRVIVAQNVSELGRNYSASEISAMSDWVNAGGGLLTLTGFAGSTEVDNVNGLLMPYGMSYGTQSILFGGGHTLPVTHWMTHPVTQGISRIGVDNGYPVQGGAMTIASEGWDVFKAREVGKGHVLVWGDEWITYDSEWGAHPDYQVQALWINILKWLSPATECQVPLPPK